MAVLEVQYLDKLLRLIGQYSYINILLSSGKPAAPIHADEQRMKPLCSDLT
jgi:hypothetical protein